MMSDDELEAIRRRKMELLMERAKKAKEPQVQEPLAKGSVVHLNDTNFWQVISQTKTALVDFFGEWCQPCKMLAPILAELAKDYTGKVLFAKVDIDRNPRVRTQFKVQSVPSVFGFKNGKPVATLPGLRSINEYDIWIERLLAA